jgi:uncharacterized protein (TIGR02757 family)
MKISESDFISLAVKYETPDFVKSDPVKFPHRFHEKRDVEIAAFIASWMAYGRREQIIKTLEMVFSLMGSSPYDYIMNQEFKNLNPVFTQPLYRFYKWADFAQLCLRLYTIYSCSSDMEEALSHAPCNCDIPRANNIYILSSIFNGVRGVPVNIHSACKRLHLFLRWMVRDNSPVDLGIWKSVAKSSLIIPLDVHSFRTASSLGMTTSKYPNLKSAIEITDKAKEFFPDDPSRADFTLFGADIDRLNNYTENDI